MASVQTHIDESAGRPPRYEGTLTVGEARARYFAANGLGDGGYDRWWVKLQAGPVPLYLPNTAARVRAVRLHDIHHVLTEYSTTWTGEAQIAAWEIASGCGRHYAAWLLNLGAFAIGLVIDPRLVFQAFRRGRRSTNLYHAVREEEGLLSARLGELRRRFDLDNEIGAATISDYATFSVWAVLSLALALAPLAALIALILS